jgi:hypothetical protein
MKMRSGWMIGLSAATLLAAFTLSAGSPVADGACDGDGGKREQKRAENRARKGGGDGEGGVEAPGRRMRERTEEMREKHQEMRAKHEADREAMRALLGQYKENPTDELRAEIREKLAAQAEQRRSHLVEQLARLEAERDRLKAQLAESEGDQEALVDRKFTELTSRERKGPKGKKNTPQE